MKLVVRTDGVWEAVADETGQTGVVGETVPREAER